jgi:hypothetical protein
MDWRSDHEAAVYMRGRGFAPEVLEDWGFGYDHWTSRIAIPVRDETGILVGFKGRSIDDRRPKYLLLGDTEGRALRYGMGYGFDMHDARSVLFGLDRARGHKRVATARASSTPSPASRRASPAVAPGTTTITESSCGCCARTSTSWSPLRLRRRRRDAVWGYADDDAEVAARAGREDHPLLPLYVCDDHEGDPASMSARRSASSTPARATGWSTPFRPRLLYDHRYISAVVLRRSLNPRTPQTPNPPRGGRHAQRTREGRDAREGSQGPF